MWGNSYAKFAILDIKFPFTCGEWDLYYNIAKFQNIATRIVLKFYFCFLHFQWWSKFLEKVLIWLKNVTSITKLQISKAEIFLKLNFWPKWNIQNSAYTKPLNLKLTQLTCFIFLLKFLELLWSYNKCQKIGVGRGLDRVRIKHLLPQTIPDKIFGT